MSHDRTEVARAAEKLLADTYTLYLKTHNFHWNVTGPMFSTLHLLFETQYTELATAVDEIAERIRTFGFRAPGSYAEFLKLTGITESTETPDAVSMIRELAADQDRVVASAAAMRAAAEAIGDEVTVDLGVRRMDVHEKNAWMLRAHLESGS